MTKEATTPITVTELQILETPSIVFTEMKKEDFFSLVRSKATAEVHDVKTKKGRDAIRSSAANIAKMKVAIDKSGIELNADANAKIKLVNAERKEIFKYLQDLQDEIRLPLTEHEQEKAKKEAEREEIATRIKSALLTEGLSSSEIESRIEKVQLIICESESLNDLADSAIAQLNEKLTLQKNQEDQAEELRILKEEKEVREKQDAKEKEEREAKEAEEEAERERVEAERAQAEKARKDADELAQKKIDDAEKEREKERALEKQREANQQEQIRLQNEKIEIQKKEAEAEKVQAKKDRVEAVEQAERNREKAVEDERRRVDAEKEQIAENERLRAADVEHRKTINNSVLSSLLSTGIEEDQGKEIIKLIVCGSIPNVTLKY